MHAGTLYLLHDAGDQEVFAIADGVHFAFGAHDVLIQQHRVIHVHMLVITPMYSMTSPCCRPRSCSDRPARRTDASAPASRSPRQPARASSRLNTVRPGARGMPQRSSSSSKRSRSSASSMASAGCPDGQADLVHVLCQLDGGLAAELHHAGVRLFGGDDVVHALRVQRVKVQAVTGIKVGGDGLGVVVDQNGLAAVLLQRPDSVHRAVVELDALTDADGAGAKDQHLLLFGSPLAAASFSAMNSAASLSPS